METKINKQTKKEIKAVEVLIDELNDKLKHTQKKLLSQIKTMAQSNSKASPRPSNMNIISPDGSSSHDVDFSLDVSDNVS